jgi:hypothetical protein
MSAQGLVVYLLVGVGLGLGAMLAVGADSAPKKAEAVQIVVGDDRIDFLHGQRLTARYHAGPKVAKPYFWPVNSPNGAAITRSWPMEATVEGEATDHIHQKSLWFCHGDVIPEGLELKHKIKNVEGVDFWSEAPGHGRIVCTKVGKPEVQGSKGKIVTENEWRTADDVKILDETRGIQLVDLGGAQLLILDIDLHASVCPITFGDTKEGSLGARVRKELTEDKGKGKLTNAEGKVGEKKGVWGFRSAWCDDSGPVGDQTIGIAILASPKNPYPSSWHSRGYGLMAANPFGRDRSGFPDVKGNKELVKLAKGDHLKLRYGVLLHQGDCSQARVAEVYKQFAEMP